ncbi:DUF1127 domain-containing protein [Devosia sp. CAU 1758]
MMLRIIKSISMRWSDVRRRRRARRDTILMLHQFSDHMLRDIGLHEPRSIDDPRFWSVAPELAGTSPAADKSQALAPPPHCDSASGTDMRRGTPRPAFWRIVQHSTLQSRI